MSKATDLFELQEDIKKSRVLTQYVNNGNDNKVIGDVTLIGKLNPGYYKIDRSMDGLHFVQDDLRTDELLRFEDSKMDETIKEVDKFWQLKKDFDDLGFVHNRGLLLYGPPGTGKSCLIKLLVEQMVSRGEVVFNASNDIGSLIIGLKAFREVEPNRKLLVVLEDVDAIIRYGEHSLLELLDGDIQIDNVLYLGTTNYMNKIPERVKRPGRFDHLVEIDFPNSNGRRAYLENKLGKFETKQEINRLVNATKGFSFGHLREYLISVYCLKKEKNEVIKRLKTKSFTALPARKQYSGELVQAIRETYIGCKVKRILGMLNS